MLYSCLQKKMSGQDLFVESLKLSRIIHLLKGNALSSLKSMPLIN